MKKSGRIMLALFIGLGLAMISMAVTIFMGYKQAYANGGAVTEVCMFGLKIYELTLAGQKYTGASRGKNMGIICAAYMFVGFVVEEVIHKLRK